jgi:hypothetical protein
MGAGAADGEESTLHLNLAVASAGLAALHALAGFQARAITPFTGNRSRQFNRFIDSAKGILKGNGNAHLHISARSTARTLATRTASTAKAKEAAQNVLEIAEHTLIETAKAGVRSL